MPFDLSPSLKVCFLLAEMVLGIYFLLVLFHVYSSWSISSLVLRCKFIFGGEACIRIVLQLNNTTIETVPPAGFMSWCTSQLHIIRPRIRWTPCFIQTLPLDTNTLHSVSVSWKFESLCNSNKIFAYFLFKLSGVDCKWMQQPKLKCLCLTAEP